jgi:2-keto-4-pentenoate hydratase/2-oxohepta-3-ene-1,7-dioic acid hydratase in catechol pathway
VILAIGLNYAAHSSELGLKTDSTPTVFVPVAELADAHDATTTWPRALSESVDYEAELGVIIGAPAKDVSPEEALTHVWGYTVVNDITARDIQYSEAQWSRCKSFDGFTPTGPFVVTADEVPDPQDLHIWTVLDGHTLQDASTNQMVRPVATLISHLSKSATLLPGTLISTGSPGGAGYSRDPQVFLRDRSTVTVGIDGSAPSPRTAASWTDSSANARAAEAAALRIASAVGSVQSTSTPWISVPGARPACTAWRTRASRRAESAKTRSRR